MTDQPYDDMVDEIPEDMSKNKYPTYKEDSILVADDPIDELPIETNKVQRKSKGKKIKHEKMKKRYDDDDEEEEEEEEEEKQR